MHMRATYYMPMRLARTNKIFIKIVSSTMTVCFLATSVCATAGFTLTRENEAVKQTRQSKLAPPESDETKAQMERAADALGKRKRSQWSAFVLPIEALGSDGTAFADGKIINGHLEELQFEAAKWDELYLILKQQAEQNQSFRAGRMWARFEGLHTNSERRAQFLQTAQERVNRNLEGIASELSRMGLEIPKHLQLEIRAGFYRFSSIHAENEPAKITLDLELLLRPDFPEPVFRFFLMHEILHAIVAKKYPGWSQGSAETFILLAGITSLWQNDQLHSVCEFLESLKRRTEYGREASDYMSSDGHLLAALKNLIRIKAEMDQVGKAIEASAAPAEKLQKSMAGLQRRAFFNARRGIQEWIVKDPTLQEELAFLDMFFSKLEPPKDGGLNLDAAGISDLAAAVDHADAEASLTIAQEVLGTKLFDELLGPDAELRKQAAVSLPLLFEAQNGLHVHRLARVIHQIHCKQKGREGPFRVLDGRTLDEKQQRLFKQLHPKGEFLEEMRGGTLFIRRIDTLKPHDLHFLGELVNNPSVDVRFIFSFSKDSDGGAQTAIPEAVLHKLTYGRNSHTIPSLIERGPQEREDLLKLTLADCAAREGRGKMEFSPDALKFLLSSEWQWPGNLFEMENVVRRAVVLAKGRRVEVRDIQIGGEKYFYEPALVDRVAQSKIPVLAIANPADDAYEVLENIIHRSGRSRHASVWIDAELFTEKNVTDILYGKPESMISGELEQARGGSIVIQNVEKLPPRAQRHLLKVLRQGGFSKYPDGPIGPLDARWYFTTSADLKDLVRRGKFIPDLYYLINGFQLDIPPLRQRREIIPKLAQDIVARAAQRLKVPEPVISPEALVLLKWYPWPGGIDQMHAVLQGAVQMAKAGPIRAEHLHPSFKLEVLLGSEYVTDWKVCKQIVQEYYPGTNFALMEMLMPERALAKVMLTDAEALQKFSQGLRKLLRQARPKFKDAPSFDKALYSPNSLQWFAKNFSQDFLQSLWDSGNLLTFLSYFFQGSTSKDAWEQAVNFIVAKNPTLQGYLAPFIKGSEDLRLRQRLLFRTYRVLFHLHLWGWPVDAPNFLDLLGGLESEAAWEKMFLDLVNKNASQPLKSAMKPLKKRLRLPPKDLELQESTMRDIQDIAVRSPNLPEEEQIGATMQYGTVLKARKLRGGIGAWEERYFPLPTALSETKEFTGRAEVEAQIRSWLNERKLDPATLRVSANTRIRYQHNYKLYERVGGFFSRVVAPCPSDLWRWREEDPVEMDDRKWVASIVHDITGRKQAVETIPEIIAGYVLGYFEAGAYRIKDAKAGGSLDLSAEQKVHVSRSKDTLAWLLEQRDPNFLQQKGAFAFLAPMVKTKKKVKRYIPPFMEPAIPPALLESLRTDEKEFLNLVMHAASEESVRERPAPVAATLEKSLSLAEENKRGREVAAMASAVERSIDNILDHSPFPMPGEQMERLIEEVFHRQTEESGNFVGWFVGKFGVRLDLKRKSEETSMLEREMIRVFKDSWNLFGNDRKKLKDLTVLFARLHGFLLRQDEADLELPFGNRHDALHVLQLLRLTEDIMTKNPLLGPNALGSHYGQHGALLAKLAVLCHDLGYAEFVQLQRKAMREAEAAIREGRDPPPMPHKSMHSALSVHIINTHLEDLLRNLFDLNAEKPGYPGRDLFADFREAVLYHSTSKKKLSNVEYNEVRNPLLFLTTLADKLDYQFHRIKEDSRFYEIFTDVLKYRDSVYRGFPNASLREQICKEVKGMSPSDYHDFLHSFGALSVCRVEVGLVLAGKPVSHAFYQMLSPKEKGNVRLVVTTVLDRHIVDLASGFGDEIGNPAYFQVERAKGSMDMFRCNGKAIEMRTKLVPLRPADEALPVWDMERRDRVLKELREEFGEEQIIDPEEFEAFVHASTQPKAIKNALLAVQALVGGPLSTRSGTPEIVKVPQAMYPLVVAIAKGIHFEEFNQKLAARLRTLAPPLPDSVDSLRYVAEHPPGLQTWLEWSKSFADDLLADAARFKRDSIRWRSSYQWHNQLKLFNQYLLPRLSELSQAEGTLRVAHLQPGYPPATMLDLANLLVEHDLDATVTGLEIVRPAFEISLANGDKVLTNMDGAVLAFDLRNTKDQRLYHSLKDRLHKFVVELPEGMQSKKEMMHPNDWEAMRREVGDIETRLKRIRTKLDKVPTQVEDGTEPEMVSLEDANHVLTSLLDQSDALVQSLKKEHLLQDADLPTQLTRRFRQEKRIESIHPELEKEIKSFVEAFQQSGSLSYESPKRWQISRISGEQGDFYKNWLATQTEKVRKRMSFDSTMTPEEGFDVVYAFNIPHVDLRTAGKKVKPRGEFFLGYGWDERRKERGNDIAFMRFEKEAEWLKSKELSFALCKDEEHYASISMQRLRELLMHCGENALLTELEAAYPGKAEKIDQDEQLPEVFRKVYLLLLQNGFNPTVNERLLLFNIHKDPRSGSWKSTPTKQTVDAILALVQDTQNDDTFEQAWKILTDIYARTNDKQLQSDVLDAVNTMQMLSYAHRVVFCKTTHQEKIRQWVRENVLVQEKTVSDAQLKRKMWVAAELSRAEKIVLNRHLFFFVYRDLSDPDALEQLLLLLNPPLQPSDLPSQGVFEFTLDIVTRLSERPGLIEKFSSDKKKMLELIRVLENIMRHSTDPYPRLLLANALVRIASQLGEPERIDTIADFLLEQMDKTMDMVQALDLVRQISYVCGLEGRKEKMVQLFEKIKDRGPQFITVFTQ